MPIELVIAPADLDNSAAWHQAAAKRLGLKESEITEVHLLKRSLDARRGQVNFRLQVEVGTKSFPLDETEALPQPNYPVVPDNAKRVLVIGAGPAGMFAALKLIQRGFKPIVLERGKDAKARAFDLAPINRRGEVNPESNYCFGEGGAGTFSDGKLYTRAKKRGPVREVYETLVAHGADPEILVDAHPHVGSNKLPKLVRALRQSILEAGGEVHFETKVTGLLRGQGGGKLAGVQTSDGQEWLAEAIILATGHSARDIYELLHAEGLLLETKPFAVGVRIEHPQAWLDERQYHLKRGEPRHRNLPASRYRLAWEEKGRPVHSFCMCPGGFVVPASTSNNWLVVNGMSHARRDNQFANSGLVVQLTEADFPKLAQQHGVLAGLKFQEQLEIAAKAAGGNQGLGQVAPAQLAQDFLHGRDGSGELPPTSYHPGLQAARLDQLFPKFIVETMRGGLRQFEKRMKGYTGAEAQLIGVETRTSSPVRIPRDEQSLQHPEFEGLFPCGEGAGYAGGIVSAALDGMRCGEAVG